MTIPMLTLALLKDVLVFGKVDKYALTVHEWSQHVKSRSFPCEKHIITE